MNWSIDDIAGSTDRPEHPRAVAILLHGFLGYKDYGLIRALGDGLASRGIMVHRFNHRCSGMTEEIDRFERPDAFERDTWRGQVRDVGVVRDAIREGALEGGHLPCMLVGHSRGGATMLLAGADMGDDLAGVVTLASPSSCLRLSPEQIEVYREQGFLNVRSNRTGQDLRVGLDWLLEQERDPEAHDPVRAARALHCPLLVVHGDRDPTVPPGDAIELAKAAGITPLLIPGANHVFDTPNPWSGERVDALDAALDATAAFVDANI